jgi:hypothetical protein
MNKQSTPGRGKQAELGVKWAMNRSRKKSQKAQRGFAHARQAKALPACASNW